MKAGYVWPGRGNPARVTATRGTGRYRLYGAKGSGAMIVEVRCARERAGRVRRSAWDDIGWNTRTLARLNPLGQVPTLVMPDGR